MPNLEEFLGKKKTNYQKNILGTVQGTFNCQEEECDEVMSEAFLNVENTEMTWYCNQDHESRIKI